MEYNGDEISDSEWMEAADPVEEHIKKRLSDKCSTCRHEYEPKPRTIRLDAELPEPETAKWSSSTVIPQLIFNITFDTHADADAWLAWWKEQVAEW